MKPHVTTREEILEKTLEIALREGIDKVSIRKLASACNIAIGSVYNYYKDKKELIAAVSRHFWDELLEDQEKLYTKNMGFTMFLHRYYMFLYGKLSKHDSSWLGAMDEAAHAQAIALFKKVLDHDSRVERHIWNMELSPDFFCEHVLNNIIALLRAGEDNCRFYIFLLEHLLYNA